VAIYVALYNALYVHLLASKTDDDMNKKSTRRERFENVAARRVQKVMDFLDSLANCSNRVNYEYSDEDVRKMFSALREKLRMTESAFGNALNKSEKNKFKF
jgi:molecular chaperone GrpE (heat shock protein)